FALLLGELGEAPVVEHAVVQPVLVDGTQLVLERLVQDVDDLFLPLHVALPHSSAPPRASCHIVPTRTAMRAPAGEVKPVEERSAGTPWWRLRGCSPSERDMHDQESGHGKPNK